MKTIQTGGLLLVIVLLLAAPYGAAGQTDETRTIKRNKQASGTRLALVIGNSDYQDKPLRNPVHDATALAAWLGQHGFTVTMKTDTTRRQLKQAIRDFGKKLRGGGVGLFYFAGHGMQIGGHNYLLPVDVEIDSESDVEFEAVDAGMVLGKMADAGNGFNIVILDACRDNPFSRGFRSGFRSGLARMNAPAGSFIAYATKPGSVAADGKGPHSPFTGALLLSLKQPGLTIEQLFKRVRIQVIEQTDNSQVPWESSSLVGDFYFHPGKTAAGSPKISGYGIDPEEELWLTVRDSDDPGDIEEYLDAYPSGRFSRTARVKIRKLKEAAERRP